MTNAETTPGQPEATPAAGGAELSIPKHRFDEVNQEVRRLREELSMKDRLYMQDRQQFAQANRPQQVETELTPEETGLDPQTHQAVIKTAKLIAGRIVAKEKSNFEQQIGILANRTEKAELLASKGSDKAKYIPEIQRMQQEHYHNTGGFLPAELAFDLIKSKENERRIADLEAKLSGQAPREAPGYATNSAQQNVPNAAATREIPGGSAPGGSGSASKSFSDLSYEEMEARLEERFKGGDRL